MTTYSDGYAAGIAAAAGVTEQFPDTLTETMSMPPSQYTIATAIRALDIPADDTGAKGWPNVREHVVINIPFGSVDYAGHPVGQWRSACPMCQKYKPPAPVVDDAMVERVARASVVEIKRQNPDIWHDWLTEAEHNDGTTPRCDGSDWNRHALRLVIQYGPPIDTVALARAAIAAIGDGGRG